MIICQLNFSSYFHLQYQTRLNNRENIRSIISLLRNNNLIGCISNFWKKNDY
jgi:hypothetical protein